LTSSAVTVFEAAIQIKYRRCIW